MLLPWVLAVLALARNAYRLREAAARRGYRAPFVFIAAAILLCVLYWSFVLAGSAVLAIIVRAGVGPSTASETAFTFEAALMVAVASAPAGWLAWRLTNWLVRALPAKTPQRHAAVRFPWRSAVGVCLIAGGLIDG